MEKSAQDSPADLKETDDIFSQHLSFIDNDSTQINDAILETTTADEEENVPLQQSVPSRARRIAKNSLHALRHAFQQESRRKGSGLTNNLGTPEFMEVRSLLSGNPVVYEDADGTYILEAENPTEPKKIDLSTLKHGTYPEKWSTKIEGLGNVTMWFEGGTVVDARGISPASHTTGDTGWWIRLDDAAVTLVSAQLDFNGSNPVGGISLVHNGDYVRKDGVRVIYPLKTTMDFAGTKTDSINDDHKNGKVSVQSLSVGAIGTRDVKKYLTRTPAGEKKLAELLKAHNVKIFTDDDGTYVLDTESFTQAKKVHLSTLKHGTYAAKWTTDVPDLGNMTMWFEGATIVDSKGVYGARQPWGGTGFCFQFNDGPATVMSVDLDFDGTNPNGMLRMQKNGDYVKEKGSIVDLPLVNKVNFGGRSINLFDEGQNSGRVIVQSITVQKLESRDVKIYLTRKSENEKKLAAIIKEITKAIQPEIVKSDVPMNFKNFGIAQHPEKDLTRSLDKRIPDIRFIGDGGIEVLDNGSIASLAKGGGRGDWAFLPQKPINVKDITIRTVNGGGKIHIKTLTSDTWLDVSGGGTFTVNLKNVTECSASTPHDSRVIFESLTVSDVETPVMGPIAPITMKKLLDHYDELTQPWNLTGQANRQKFLSDRGTVLHTIAQELTVLVGNISTAESTASDNAQAELHSLSQRLQAAALRLGTSITEWQQEASLLDTEPWQLLSDASRARLFTNNAPEAPALSVVNLSGPNATLFFAGSTEGRTVQLLDMGSPGNLGGKTVHSKQNGDYQTATVTINAQNPSGIYAVQLLDATMKQLSSLKLHWNKESKTLSLADGQNAFAPTTSIHDNGSLRYDELFAQAKAQEDSQTIVAGPASAKEQLFSGIASAIPVGSVPDFNMNFSKIFHENAQMQLLDLAAQSGISFTLTSTQAYSGFLELNPEYKRIGSGSFEADKGVFFNQFNQKFIGYYQMAGRLLQKTMDMVLAARQGKNIDTLEYWRGIHAYFDAQYYAQQISAAKLAGVLVPDVMTMIGAVQAIYDHRFDAFLAFQDSTYQAMKKHQEDFKNWQPSVSKDGALVVHKGMTPNESERKLRAQVKAKDAAIARGITGDALQLYNRGVILAQNNHQKVLGGTTVYAYGTPDTAAKKNLDTIRLSEGIGTMEERVAAYVKANPEAKQYLAGLSPKEQEGIAMQYIAQNPDDQSIIDHLSIGVQETIRSILAKAKSPTVVMAGELEKVQTILLGIGIGGADIPLDNPNHAIWDPNARDYWANAALHLYDSKKPVPRINEKEIQTLKLTAVGQLFLGIAQKSAQVLSKQELKDLARLVNAATGIDTAKVTDYLTSAIPDFRPLSLRRLFYPSDATKGDPTLRAAFETAPNCGTAMTASSANLLPNGVVRIRFNYATPSHDYARGNVYLLNEQGKQLSNTPLVSGDFRNTLYIDLPLDRIASVLTETYGKPIGAANLKFKVALYQKSGDSSGLQGMNITGSLSLNVHTAQKDLSTNVDAGLRQRENVILSQIADPDHFVIRQPGEWRWTIGSEYHHDSAVHAADLNWGSLGNSDRGKDVFAPAAGIVKSSTVNENTGLTTLVIEHKHANGTVWYSKYLHMDDITLKAKDTVTKDLRLGTVSDKGSLGQNHLHFEVLDEFFATVDMRKLLVDNFKMDTKAMSRIGTPALNTDGTQKKNSDGSLMFTYTTNGAELKVDWDPDLKRWYSSAQGLVYGRDEQASGTPNDSGSSYWYVREGTDVSKMKRVVWDKATEAWYQWDTATNKFFENAKGIKRQWLTNTQKWSFDL